MRLRVTVAAVVLLACSACGGTKREAAAPEANPWADYKGTYAPGGAAEAPVVSAAEVKSATADDKSDNKSDKPVKTADARPTKGAKPGKTPKTAKPAKAEAAEPEPAPAPTKAAPVNDAMAMYDIPTTPKADDPAPEPAPKKVPKKRAGRKGAKKPAAAAKP